MTRQSSNEAGNVMHVQRDSIVLRWCMIDVSEKENK